MRMTTPAPNYTQTPNDLFDHWLPHLGEIELKVLLIVMRQTFGWHRTRVKISISLFQKLTGSIRSNIVKAVNSLLEKGIISKEIVGNLGTEETYYELVIDDRGVVSNQDPGGSLDPRLGGVSNQYPPSLEDNTYRKERIKENDDDAGAREAADCGKQQDPKICKDDVHFACMKLSKDWTSEEIDKAWNGYEKYSGNITDPLKYIESIIKKNRSIQNQKEYQCQLNQQPKKKPKSMPKKEPLLRTSLEICKENFSENDMSERPLANFMEALRRTQKFPVFS